MNRRFSAPPPGFTLLEILVALAVLAIAMTALMKASSQNLDNTAYLRDKTVAHWVAMNRMSELRIQNSWPNPGRSQGSEVMLGNEWFWRMTINNTPDAAMRRIDVEVRRTTDDDVPLTVLVGFIGQP